MLSFHYFRRTTFYWTLFILCMRKLFEYNILIKTKLRLSPSDTSVSAADQRLFFCILRFTVSYKERKTKYIYMKCWYSLLKQQCYRVMFVGDFIIFSSF